MMKQLLITISLISLSSCNPEPLVSDINPEYQTNLLIENGGRISWYQGTLHSKVLFDRISQPLSANTDVYLMEPDGTNIECLTCDIDLITNGFVGQPVWHPNGIHCVIQAENANSKHTRFEHVSFGLNNDLWLLNTETKEVEKIYSTELNDAALHPQFNEAGNKLIFSKRTASGVSIPELVNITPGGENHWDGWSIQVNEFDLSESGLDIIKNSKLLQPNGTGFYETHSISDRLVYSFTPNGNAYVDDCFMSDIEGENIYNLTESTKTWEEHATFSPSKENFIYISSRHDEDWTYPESDTRTINTELYIQSDTTNAITQLTNFNSTQDEFRVLTSDFDWSTDGSSVIFLVAKIHKTNILLTTNEIWKIEFDEPK